MMTPTHYEASAIAGTSAKAEDEQLRLFIERIERALINRR